MNFQDLISKISALDQPIAETVQPPVQAIMAPSSGPATPDKTGDSGHLQLDVDECGDMPMLGAMAQPKQQDNVTMNISMNGSGSGGIRDLMDILKSIEKGAEGDHPAMVVGLEDQLNDKESTGEPQFDEPHDKLFGEKDQDMEEDGDYQNRPHPIVKGEKAMVPTGDDLLAKQHWGALKPAGGENPARHMHAHESLVNKLSQMYQAIKEERTEEKDDKGNVVRWKEEGEWTKKSGKEGRGKVTNLSDKARRETEKMSNKEKEVAEGGWTLPPDDASPEEKDAIMQRNKAGQDYINSLASQKMNQNAQLPVPNPPAAVDNGKGPEYVPRDYQTKEPLQKGPDGKWRNSKGEERDGLHGGPMMPGTNGGPSTAQFRSLRPRTPQESTELVEMLKIAGLR